MGHPRRDGHLFAPLGPEDPALQLQLQLAFQNHQELIGGMDIVFPHLPRRVNPEPATEPANAPFALDVLPIDLNGFPIHFGTDGTFAYLLPFRALAYATALPVSEATKFLKLSSEIGSLNNPLGPSPLPDKRKQTES